MNGWAWSNGGMILTGENWSTRRKPSPISTLSTRKPKCTVLWLNPFLRCERSTTDLLNPQSANSVARSVHLTFLMHFNSHTFSVFCLTQPNYATVRIKTAAILSIHISTGCAKSSIFRIEDNIYRLRRRITPLRTVILGQSAVIIWMCTTNVEESEESVRLWHYIVSLCKHFPEYFSPQQNLREKLRRHKAKFLGPVKQKSKNTESNPVITTSIKATPRI